MRGTSFFIDFPLAGLLVVLIVMQSIAVLSFQTPMQCTLKGKSSLSLAEVHTTKQKYVQPLGYATQGKRETRLSLTKVDSIIESWFRAVTQGPTNVAGAASILLASMVLVMPTIAIADEYGRETEAPTLFTGETVLICTKRGPLGACLKTEARTADNDNDKSNKYMPSPEAEAIVRSREQALQAVASQESGSDLLTKLRQQTVDNKEKNDKLVKQKTIQNNQAASFGPFDRQVVVLNADGESYTLLENPQAMRLKKQGYINKNRQFIKQPSEEVLQAAMEPGEDEGLAGIAKAIFGGGEKE